MSSAISVPVVGGKHSGSFVDAEPGVHEMQLAVKNEAPLLLPEGQPRELLPDALYVRVDLPEGSGCPFAFVPADDPTWTVERVADALRTWPAFRK